MNKSTSVRLKNLLLNNLSLKIGAVLIAVVLWLHATNIHVYEQIFTVPIDLKGLSDSLVITTRVPEKARITFRGKGDQLLWLSFRKPRVTVMLDEVQFGVNTIELHGVDVDLPGGVEVIGIDILTPRNLRFSIDRLQRKAIPIRAHTEGLPAPGYIRVGNELELSPAEVTVEGPADMIQDLEYLQSEPLDIENAKDTVSKDLRIRIPDAVGFSVSTRQVRVTAPIEKLLRKTMEIRIPLADSLPEGWKLHESMLSVHILARYGMRDSLERLESDDLLTKVEIPKNPPDTLRIPVPINPPSWVQQCLIRPDSLLIIKTTASAD